MVGRNCRNPTPRVPGTCTVVAQQATRFKSASSSAPIASALQAAPPSTHMQVNRSSIEGGIFGSDSNRSSAASTRTSFSLDLLEQAESRDAQRLSEQNAAEEQARRQRVTVKDAAHERAMSFAAQEEVMSVRRQEAQRQQEALRRRQQQQNEEEMASRVAEARAQAERHHIMGLRARQQQQQQRTLEGAARTRASP
eukprot:2913292-Prymnesium_polylepis.1